MLTLTQANRVAAAAHDHAAANGIAPLCVTVLDAGGHTLAVQRNERASLYRPDIAAAKAMGCLGMGFGGRAMAQRAQAAPAFYAAVAALRPLLPVPGGVLIRDADGTLIGAVGISGDTAPNDEACAVAGIEAAGLVADTGA